MLWGVFLRHQLRGGSSCVELDDVYEDKELAEQRCYGDPSKFVKPITPCKEHPPWFNWKTHKEHVDRVGDY